MFPVWSRAAAWTPSACPPPRKGGKGISVPFDRPFQDHTGSVMPCRPWYEARGGVLQPPVSSGEGR